MIYILRKYILCFISPLGRVVHNVYTATWLSLDTSEPETVLLLHCSLILPQVECYWYKGKKTKLNWIYILLLVRGPGHIIHLCTLSLRTISVPFPPHKTRQSWSCETQKREWVSCVACLMPLQPCCWSSGLPCCLLYRSFCFRLNVCWRALYLQCEFA